MNRIVVGFLIYWCCVRSAQAGPYLNLGIRAADASFTQWGSTVVNYSPAPGVSASFANPSTVLGVPNGQIASLGDLSAAQISGGVLPGSVTLAYASTFRNGDGWDLAVFENAGSFSGTPNFVFGELAYVEVSSDGINFARFPSVSLNKEPGQGIAGDTELRTNFGRAFAELNVTNVRNLAGIHSSNVGTAFDLADLQTDPLVGAGLLSLDAVRYIRLVDIPGNGVFLDSLDNPILDTWLTTGSGGLDLDAVGTRYLSAVPEPSTWLLIGGAFSIVLGNRRRRKSRGITE
jgi:hypothetical protein